jgi:hypothetical protein
VVLQRGIQDSRRRRKTFLEGPAYYYAFSIAMLVATVGFVVFVSRDKGNTFIHGETAPKAETEAEANVNV